MYLKLLKNPIFLKLAIIQLLVYFGSFFTSVAIYTLAINFKVSPTQNALIVIMFTLPGVFGVINGAIVDKYNLKNLMRIILIFELIFTSLFLTITSVEQLYLLMLFIFLRTLCSFLFFTSQMSLFPQITKNSKELKTINELHSIIWSTTFAIGMSLGGIFVKYFGIYNTIKLDILLFLVAIILFFSIDIKLKPKRNRKITHLIISG